MNTNNQTKVEAKKIPPITLEQPDDLELSGAEADRRALERITKTERPILEAEKGEVGAASIIATPVPTAGQVEALEKDQITVEVENILEDGIKDIYDKLPDNIKPVFKQKGEETALTIAQMIKKAAVKLGEIMKLIFSWLKIIPGVNRFYLEQEAKIKADRIMVLVDEMKNDKPKA